MKKLCSFKLSADTLHKLSELVDFIDAGRAAESRYYINSVTRTEVVELAIANMHTAYVKSAQDPEPEKAPRKRKKKSDQ